MDNEYLVRHIEALSAMTLKTGSLTGNREFLFPKQGPLGEGKPVGIRGTFAVNAKPTTESGDTDTLKLTLCPIVEMDGENEISHSSQEITLVEALDWDSDGVYHFPIDEAVGPCVGFQVYADITGVEDGTELSLLLNVAIA